jgi:DNA-binding NarL/FixJ family response regulator
VRRPVRVLLVEDNDVYRESLAFLLGRREDVEVVGEAATGSAAAAACVELDADVAVIDFRLPDIDGAEAAAAVRERSPATSVVFLSASAGPEERDAARISGWTLVQKVDGIEALVAAIRRSVGKEV